MVESVEVFNCPDSIIIGENFNEENVELKVYLRDGTNSVYKGEDLEAKTEVVSAKYEKGAVTVKLNRLGNVSSRHKIEILDKDGNKIGENDKVRIYLPNKSLELSISLKKDVKTSPKTLVLKDGLSGKEILRKNISL